jgi:hypothetical protein
VTITELIAQIRAAMSAKLEERNKLATELAELRSAETPDEAKIAEVRKAKDKLDTELDAQQERVVELEAEQKRDEAITSPAVAAHADRRGHPCRRRPGQRRPSGRPHRRRGADLRCPQGARLRPAHQARSTSSGEPSPAPRSSATSRPPSSATTRPRRVWRATWPRSASSVPRTSARDPCSRHGRLRGPDRAAVPDRPVRARRGGHAAVRRRVQQARSARGRHDRQPLADHDCDLGGPAGL